LPGVTMERRNGPWPRDTDEVTSVLSAKGVIAAAEQQQQ
jgi:hypothetical protein